MSDEREGRHAAVPDLDNAAAFRRPDGMTDSFAPRPAEPLYTPPPPTVSPEERAVFGRTAGQPPFDPPPGERMPPTHQPVAQAVHPELTRSFGRTPTADADGFDPAPGSRLAPTGKGPGSPWWKPGAARDPWRDPASQFWLGRPAVFLAGRPSQLEPDTDTEQDDDLPPVDEDDEPPATGGGGRRARFGLSALLLTLLVALVAGTLGGGAGYWLSERAHRVLTNPDIKLIPSGTPANRPPGSVADIARRLSPATVSIEWTTAEEAGVGSGVVIKKDGQYGYILTNNHVVSIPAQASRPISVTFSNHQTVVASLVGRDPTTDLAVLRVTAPNGMAVAPIGDSSKLAVGDPVIAIGSPYGLSGTVTTGIVSALDRPVAVAGETGDPNVVLDAIQTDAAINQGNSGGPLIDAAGTVVGINSAGKAATSIGIGYAIPIDSASAVATELINTGKVVHASIGLQANSVTDGSRQGAKVEQVAPGGPAAQAGLKPGDVITVVDQTLIDSADRLTVTIVNSRPGQVVTVHYYPYQSGTEKDVKVTLGKA